MPRTRRTTTEKLDIVQGLSKTNLSKTEYLKSYNVHKSTVDSWLKFYVKDSSDELQERRNWNRYSLSPTETSETMIQNFE